MKSRVILALAPALMLAAAAHAQPAGPPSGPPLGPHGAPTAEMKARHEAMQKQHLDDLRTILRIRPDQEAALTAFVEAHKPQFREFKGPPEPRALTTPQRLEEMAQRDAEMDAQRDRMRQALTKFYAALSPEQQKVFDALQRVHGPPMGGPMGGRMLMMHGGPGGGGPHMMIRRLGPGGPEGDDDGPPGHEPPR